MGKGFIYLLLLSLIVSCKEMSCGNKHITKLQLSIGYVNIPSSCSSSKVGKEIVVLLQPFELNRDSAGVFVDSKIYQFNNSPILTVSLTNTLRTSLGQGWLKEQPMEKIKSDFNEMIDNVDNEKLCVSNNNYDNALKELTNHLQSEQYTNVFILSSKLTDSVWNKYTVFRDVNILKQSIIDLFRRSAQEKFFVIVEPENNVNNKDTITIKGTKYPPAPPSQSNDKIHDLLMKINKEPNYDERMKLVDSAMKNVFSKDFEVEAFMNNEGVSSHLWDNGHGKDYLKNIAVDRSLLNVKIINTPRDTITGKIISMRVVEIHKN